MHTEDPRPAEMTIPTLSLQQYLRHLGMAPEHTAHELACEVCNGTQYTVIRASVQVQQGLLAGLKVVACDRCGYLWQNPRFDPAVYAEYYSGRYRVVLDGSAAPGEGFIEDQVSRGEHLFRNLEPLLAAPGRMLDVGCSSGGVMQAFLARGWEGYGTDPDAGYVEYGIRHLHAPIAVQSAEEMTLEPHSYDLIVITGSLEHVADPNRVLALCRAASRPNALIVLEGRGIAQARQTGGCGHNHRRFLTASSIRLFMCKHGWQPLWITDEELCGSTRPQSVFGIGRACAPIGADQFEALLERTDGDSPAMMLRDFDRWRIG